MNEAQRTAKTASSLYSMALLHFVYAHLGLYVRKLESSLLSDVASVQESEETYLRMGVAPKGRYLFSIVFIQESAKIALRALE